MASSAARSDSWAAKLSADEMQIKARKARKFEETEAALPILKITSLSTQLINVQGILAHLGNKNPLARQVTKDDVVWMLDNVAFKPGRFNSWQAEFVTAVFERESKERLVDLVGAIARIIGLADEAHEFATLEERLLPFVWDLRPGRRLAAAHGEKRLALGPTGPNGIASDLVKLPAGKPGALAKTNASVPQGVTGILSSWTYFAEPEGWSVISDVDDTIKVTLTNDPIGILRETFINTPRPIRGMPELYATLKGMLPQDTPWFYLSASPYNLYPFLREFRNQYYPPGAILLREVSWRTIAGLLTALTTGTEKYKSERLDRIHSWFPKRKMILVGDSTQSDPEAYGELYRLYPGWVKCILIRKATDISSVGIEEKNAPERFDVAFKGIPKEVWYVFNEPEECHQVLQNVISRG
ncbi:hypothetical protein jhhlp_002650 [Lomentospora prolificans]|uniref:Phosphatidate phosphatase APP1 catalytic domain-containing protein n=1 Tax=Lomentospora prolificans TaxID=41688 RepID=A0A2N3NEV2_9PEZI|nr:hypothetical protein jhhlp_002650 [Lomentospora prolificans]